MVDIIYSMIVKDYYVGQDGNLGFSPAMDFAEKALEQINELKEQ